jgi:hypothetical protein
MRRLSLITVVAATLISWIGPLQAETPSYGLPSSNAGR